MSFSVFINFLGAGLLMPAVGATGSLARTGGTVVTVPGGPTDGQPSLAA